MGQSLFFRWFGLGAMPDPIRAQVLAEHPLVFAEGYRGWLRRRGTLPGGIIVRGIRSMHGSFAVTSSRVVVTAGKHVVAGVLFANAVASANSTIQVDSTGLRLNVDVGSAVRGGTGNMELKFNRALTSDELAQLPAAKLSFSIEEHAAVALFRAYR